jgi:nucleotide-binding universal stress UspA family protein
MLPIKTILHATDFSEISEQGFRVACGLARDYGARLLVLHVAEIPITGSEVELLVLSAASNPALRQKLELLRPRDPRIPVEHRLIEGNPAEEIVRAARETKSDVIVLGTHGRRGVRRLVMGSVAEQVLRKAPCPVVTVKGPAADFPRVEAPVAESAGVIS